MNGRRGRDTDGPPLTSRQRDALFKVERQLAAAVQELAKSLRDSAKDRVESYHDEVRLALTTIAELRDATEGLCQLEILMARRGTPRVWPMSWGEIGMALGRSKQRLHRHYRPQITESVDIRALIRELGTRSQRMHSLAHRLNQTVTTGRSSHQRDLAERKRQAELERQERAEAWMERHLVPE